MTNYESVAEQLTADQRKTLAAVKSHAERLLNHTPRFKFFTLHGTAHIENLFEILSIFMQAGINPSREELFLLSLAICIHDLGMVVTLKDKDIKEILEGKPNATDPATVEGFIRETHHELVDAYLQHDLSFLLSLGLNPVQLGQVRDISRCHRKVVLEKQHGMIRYLGALLRIIDELDLGSNRAPADVFMNNADAMDSTSCWHWFKHNIIEQWSFDHTVFANTENGRKKILFKVAVRPTRERSIAYWLTQSRRPIIRALLDEGAQRIILDKFGVLIEVEMDSELSSVNNLGSPWAAIEEKALSAGHKVVLVIDDEFKKLEDLFYPLMDDYHVIAAIHAKDAFTKMDAGHVDLAIVDMQVGSGFIWSEEETQEFKATGARICEEIRLRYPMTKIGVLTGTRHAIPNLESLNLEFFLRKPVDPHALYTKVKNVLG